MHRSLSAPTLSLPAPLPCGGAQAPRWVARACSLVGVGLVLALAGTLASADENRDPDPPGGLAIPISGTNIYGIPEATRVKVFSGHLGGECTPKLLAEGEVVGHGMALTASDDRSTLAYITSKGACFERREGLATLQGHLALTQSDRGVGRFVLSGDGRRAAWVTSEYDQARACSRESLWTLDLTKLKAPLKARRVKRAAPGVGIWATGWAPDGSTLLYVETSQVRDFSVNVLILRDVPAQSEQVLDRSFEAFDFVLPVQGAGSKGVYRVLVGTVKGLRWVSPNGSPDERVSGPNAVPFISLGLTDLAVRRQPALPLEVVLVAGIGTTRFDGSRQRGVFRLRGEVLERLSDVGRAKAGYGTNGLLSVTERSSIRFFAEKTNTTLEFVENDRARVIRSTSWHPSRPLLAIALDDELLVLDFEGKLPHDASPRGGWNEFVGLRAPGSPNPTLHIAFKLDQAKSLPERFRHVLWHEDRLSWTTEAALVWTTETTPGR